MSDEYAGRCGSCAAYKRMGGLGACAREMFPYPLAPTSTCSLYHARGTPYLVPKRRGTTTRGARSPGGGSSPRSPVSFPLPAEIDLDMDMETFRSVLAEVLREELGLGEVDLGARWQGGEMILKPGKEGTAEKRIPIESVFHKIVMIRDRLRVLEAKVNAHPTMSDEEKVALQQYVTGCYGSLTTFNVLFQDVKTDGFRGAAGKDE